MPIAYLQALQALGLYFSMFQPSGVSKNIIFLQTPNGSHLPMQ